MRLFPYLSAVLAIAVGVYCLPRIPAYAILCIAAGCASLYAYTRQH